MKVYLATRFEGADGKRQIDMLSKAVRDAGMKDFSFIRDVENYKKTFDNPKDLWSRAFDEIGACDALLIDVSDRPTGGRLVEAGIAYALGKPVIVTKQPDVEYKQLFDGISATVISYHDAEDLSKQLKRFEKQRTFSFTDSVMTLIMFVSLGLVAAWFASQVWIPLAIVVVVAYWLLVRRLVAPMRDYDRVIIFIPLIAVWIGGYFLLSKLFIALALAWAIIFWLIVLPLLKAAKFSLR